MLMPFAASAHQRATYTINGSTYQFVIGSLNEPIAVDDKTGLDLTVTRGSGAATMSADGDMDGMSAASVPVTGLESSLKVELVAGNQKKTLSLSPVYGKAGAYSAAFYPTVATTFSYHLTGTIGDTPVDLTFTCTPEGTPKAADDTSSVKISDGVTRTLLAGGFSCPASKESLGFPEQSASVSALSASLKSLGTTTHGALGIAVAALVLAVLALVRRRR